MTVVLAAVAIVAVGIGVSAAIRGRGGTSASQRWSAWSPPDGGTQGAREIADFLGPQYRSTAAQQLDVILVMDLASSEAQQAAAQAQAQADGTSTNPPAGLEVAVRPRATSSQLSVLSGSTIAYNLCGVGHSCSIGGTASTNRGLLLRREALELALYTFKYIHGTQNVVAVLPPSQVVSDTTSTLSRTPPTSNAPSTSKPLDSAVLFERSELAPLLQRPLAETFFEPQPPSVAQMSQAPEAQLVSEVTARGLFSEQIQRAEDGSNLLVLNPLPAQ